MINDKINLRFDLDLDIEAQTETEAHKRLKVYKHNMAKSFKLIIFQIYILQYDNFLLL